MNTTDGNHDFADSRADDTGPPTSVRWTVMAFVAFASASAYLTRYCVSAANTTIGEELGFDDKAMGWILGGFSLGYLFFQVPGGWLGNRFGTRFAFAFTSILWSLCNVWSGAVSSMVALWSSRFGLGAMQAGLTPISAKILKDWIPLQNRGMSSASIGACMSVGGAVTLWMTGELLQKGYDWRVVFYAYSMVGIVWAIAFYWFFRTRPEDHAGVNATELALIRQAEETPKAAPAKPSGKPTYREGGGFGLAIDLFRSPSMFFLCVQSFFRAAGYAFFVTWFFAFLEYVYDIDKDEAGFLNSLPLLAVVIGSLSGGAIVDSLLRWTDSKRFSRSGTGLVSLSICGVITLASAWTTSAAQLATVMAIGAMFSGVGSPASWATTIDLGGRHTAIVMGIMNMAGCLAGFLMPVLLGNWFDTIKQSGGNWDQVIYLHAAFYFAAALSWLFIDPTRALIEEEP